LRKLLLIPLIFNALLTNAQLVEVPIAPPGNPSAKAKNSSARIQSLGPMPLPFWDDFSFTQTKDFPNDTLWQWRERVWVNQGRGINPPSIFTATFDGIDSTGKPYDLNDVLAKGFADKLVSRPIALDALPVSIRLRAKARLRIWMIISVYGSRTTTARGRKCMRSRTPLRLIQPFFIMPL
jgi:hypothetical protein